MKKDIGYMEEEGFSGGMRIILYRTQVPNTAAELATHFIERWGMVAGQPDGEDSSGRSKIRLATPKEMVDRAMETAELLLDTIEKKGWVIEIPAPKPAEPRRERKEE
jgi:hypothetical protein